MSSMGSRRGRQLSRTPRKRGVSSAYSRGGSRVSSSLSSRSSRIGGNVLSRPTSWGSRYRDPFPAVEKYQMRYSQTITINPGIGACGVYKFRANSIFDPDYTGIGHQPYGHDNLESIYQHYTVDSSTITVTPTVGVAGVWGIQVDDNSNFSTAGFDRAVESQATSVCVTGSTNGQSPQTLKKSYNRFSSFPTYKDTSSLFGASPSEEAYFHVWYRGLREDLDAPDGTFLITITFNVTCFELKDLGSS